MWFENKMTKLLICTNREMIAFGRVELALPTDNSKNMVIKNHKKVKTESVGVHQYILVHKSEFGRNMKHRNQK